jgi:hypothetical protein
MDEEQAARELVEAHLRARTRWTLALGVILLVLGLGGCGVFFHTLDAADALAHKGVKVQAMIDSASNYVPRSFSQGHLDVTYETPQGLQRGVRVYLPEDTSYRAGGRVEVAYDKHHPRHAVLAKGGDPGPLALWSFIAALVLGIALFVVVPMRRRRIRAVREALAETPDREQVTTQIERRGPIYTQRSFTLDGRFGFNAMTKRGWHLPDGTPHDALVFESVDGCAVVDVASRSVAVSGD